MNHPEPGTVTTVKRVTLETAATLQGLLDLLADLPNEVPHEARIMHAAQYADFAEHDAADHEDPDFEPELVERLVIALEWDA